MNQIIRRATIDETEAHRNRAVELFGAAWDTLQEAYKAARAASPSGLYELPGLRFGRDQWDVDTREKYVSRVTAEVDRGVWSHLVKATGLERLMDRTELERFREDLRAAPPPATAENCAATFERLIGEADVIFKRGIALAFARLDRRFRSHDGFKIGARVVLSNMMSECGFWHSYRRHDDTLADIERAFAVLDGKPAPERHAGIVGAVDEARRKGGIGAKAYEVESEHFRVRVFKNGNAHIWFKRDDLVERVNLLLADYYGAALGAGADVADRKHAPASTPARNFGFFPTPEAVAARAMEEAMIQPGQTVLEPSAGHGALAFPAVRAGAVVTCVEVQPAHVAELRRAIPRDRVICGDFLAETPEGLGRFDRIVMNPPFDLGRDVDHVSHALGFLKPGGRLVAIMSAGVEFREDRKTADFRALVERLGGRFYDLPPGSFSEVGTNVNTVLLSLKTRPS